MKRLLLAACLFLAPFAAYGQAYSTGPQTCGPVTGTLTSVGDSVSLPCPGASGYVIQFTANGSAAALSGTISSTDSTTGGGRLLFKTGVAELDVPTVTMTGSSTGLVEYRSTGAGYGQKITLTAVTSGSATVTIIGNSAPATILPNAPFHTSDEAAMRAGRAFTASTGFQSTAVGSYLVQTLTNPAGSGVRDVIPPYDRIIGCNNPSSALLPNFASAVNVTSGAPTTALTVSKRGSQTGAAAQSTSTGGVQTALPATTPANANPTGMPTFGGYAVPQERTLEPGNTYTIWIQGVAIPTGLASTTPSCASIISWTEEAIN